MQAAAAAAPLEPPEIFLDLTVEAPFVFAESAETASATHGRAVMLQPPQPPPEPLVHRLMENVDAPKELDRVYDRDYLALRYRAFTRQKGGTDPWKGATVLEKQLVLCVDEDGALRRDRVIHFISHITECSKNWALPLAILERSQKADEEDAKLADPTEEKKAKTKSTNPKKRKRGKRKRDEDEDSDYSEKEDAVDDEEDEWHSQGDDVEMHQSSSTPNNNSSSGQSHKQSFETMTVTEMSPQVVKVQTPPVKTARMALFVQLGGLKILSAWLAETKVPETKTGSLMLPLLALIKKIPFNFQAIERSKINKTILSIKRDVKKLKTQDTVSTAHPVFCNNSVDDVWNAVNSIIKLWKEETVANKTSTETLTNPLASFEDKMKIHIRKIEEEWANRFSAKGSQSVAGGKRTVGLSVKERAKIERLKESEANLRKDLEKTERARAEANRKLREAQAKRDPPKPPPRIGARSVCWKDGLRTGKAIPELLLSVREFNKYQTAAGEDVPFDPEVEEMRRVDKAKKEVTLGSGTAIAEQEPVGVQVQTMYQTVHGDDFPIDPDEMPNIGANSVDNVAFGQEKEANKQVTKEIDPRAASFDGPLRHGRGTQYSPLDLTDFPDDDNRDVEAVNHPTQQRDRSPTKKPVPKSQAPKKKIYGRKKKQNNKWKGGKR
jgi:hypothetical protein